MSAKHNIVSHEHTIIGIVVVTLIAGAMLLGMKIGFEYGLARCGL